METNKEAVRVECSEVSFFRMNTKVKTNVRSTKASTQVRMLDEKPVISNTGNLFCVNSNEPYRWCNAYSAHVGSNPGRVTPKTIKLIYVVPPVCTQH